METSEFIATVESLHRDARARGLFFQYSEDQALHARQITLLDRELTSFASCSYLGLEQHPALIAGVHDAVDRYGTQFSVSRGYLSCRLYSELEELLERMFEAPILVTPTTTLGHQAFFDATVTEKDAILLDHQVHASVHRAATLAKAGGTHVELVHHEALEKSIDRARELARSYRTVWFCTDGVTSMYGDLAPIALLEALLDVAPNLRLYIDDAHGMSWAGKHGRGSFLSRMPLGDRTVVAVSLNKAFSGSGGAIVFPTVEERDKVRMCGGTMTFSGPLQPPMLGACVASARVHLSDEIVERQAKLAELVGYANTKFHAVGLPLLVENESPIFFVRCGIPRISAEVAQRVAKDGLYVNVSMYPSVPMRRSGIRVSITAAHTHADVDRAVDSIAVHLPAVLAEEGMTRAELESLFLKAVVSDLMRDLPAPATFEQVLTEYGAARPARRSRPPPATREGSGMRLKKLDLRIQHERSIHALSASEWDSMLGTVGCISAAALATAEEIFRAPRKPEYEWDFDYVIVRSSDGEPLAATVFTTLLQKDDMLMRDDVSRLVEVHRATNPYFLTSKVVITGTGLSEGNHVWLSSEDGRTAALGTLLRVGAEIQQRSGATALVVRDLPGRDAALDAFMLDEGLVKLPGLDSHVVRIDWDSDQELLASLPERRYRKVARRTMAQSGDFAVNVVDSASPEHLAYLHELYRAVAKRKLRLNTFELPSDILAHLSRSPAWEIIEMRLAREAGGPDDGAPVAFWAAHVHGGHYAPLFCGLDYRFVATHSTYKQMIRQVLKRARASGSTTVHLGMDADLEKRRWGSEPQATAIYLQATDHYNGAVLRELVAEASSA
jgi:7-keto-8-aminopelargonate synthetase-like enzyme